MITLIHDDCLNTNPPIVDLILTDPPYGTTQCGWDNLIPYNEMWDYIHKNTHKNTPVLLFGTEPFSSYLRLSNIKEYRYDWIWHKNSSGSFATAKKMPMKYHENISVFYQKLPTYNPQFQEYAESTKHRFKEGEKQNRTKQLQNSTNQIHGGLSLEGSTFHIKRGKYPESVQKFKGVPVQKRHHPSQKPVELLEYFIKTYTNKDDLVLDFTMGSGSTGIACLNTNRNFIGIEKDKEIYDIAVKRIKEHQTQTRLIYDGINTRNENTIHKIKNNNEYK